MSNNINIELLHQELTWISEHPAQHDQRVWMRNPTGSRGRPHPSRDWTCRTTACLAGWVAIHTGWEPVWGPMLWMGRMRRGDHQRQRHAATIASAALGLTHRQAERLFYEAAGLHQLWDLANEFTDGAIPRWVDTVYAGSGTP